MKTRDAQFYISKGVIFEGVNAGDIIVIRAKK